jgi:hypothetical protein
MKNKQFTTRLTALVLAVMLAAIGMTGCGDTTPTEAPTEDTSYLQAYEEYVDSVLDANYHAEYDAYMTITGANKENASNAHEVHVVNLVLQLADWYDIKLDKLPEEIGNELTEICREIYMKVDYRISGSEKSGDSVVVLAEIKPMDYLTAASEAAGQYTKDFNDRAKAGEFERMTESEYENEYAKGLLEVLEDSVDDVVFGAAKTYRIKIQYDTNTGVSYIGEDDLAAIDQMIFAQ